MAESLHAKIRRKALIAGGLLALVLGVGTAAYKHIGGERASWLDSLYMVVITIATIGYGEIIDLSHSPGGRIFTMFLSFAGIGIMTLAAALGRLPSQNRPSEIVVPGLLEGLDNVGRLVAPWIEPAAAASEVPGIVPRVA